MLSYEENKISNGKQNISCKFKIISSPLPLPALLAQPYQLWSFPKCYFTGVGLPIIRVDDHNYILYCCWERPPQQICFYDVSSFSFNQCARTTPKVQQDNIFFYINVWFKSRDSNKFPSLPNFLNFLAPTFRDMQSKSFPPWDLCYDYTPEFFGTFLCNITIYFIWTYEKFPGGYHGRNLAQSLSTLTLVLSAFHYTGGFFHPVIGSNHLLLIKSLFFTV